MATTNNDDDARYHRVSPNHVSPPFIPPARPKLDIASLRTIFLIYMAFVLLYWLFTGLLTTGVFAAAGFFMYQVPAFAALMLAWRDRYARRSTVLATMGAPALGLIVGPLGGIPLSLLMGRVIAPALIGGANGDFGNATSPWLVIGLSPVFVALMVVACILTAILMVITPFLLRFENSSRIRLIGFGWCIFCASVCWGIWWMYDAGAGCFGVSLLADCTNDNRWGF